MKHHSTFVSARMLSAGAAVLLGCASAIALADSGVPINSSYSPDIEKIQEGANEADAGQKSNNPDEVNQGVGLIIEGLGLGSLANCPPSQQSPTAQGASQIGPGGLTLQLGSPAAAGASQAAGQAASQAGQSSNLIRNHTEH